MISLLLSEISTGEEIVRNKISWGFMLMLLWHCEWGKTDLQTGQPWGARWWKMIMKDDDEINALESWSSWHQKLGHKWKCIVCHQCTWLPAVLTAANGNCSWRMQTAQGAVGDPPEKQPRLSMFPSFHSELLPLKWAVIIGPEPPWVHLQVSETCSFCSLQGPLPSGCACSYPPCSFDAIGRAANLVIAAAASNKYLTWS